MSMGHSGWNCWTFAVGCSTTCTRQKKKTETVKERNNSITCRLVLIQFPFAIQQINPKNYFFKMFRKMAKTTHSTVDNGGHRKLYIRTVSKRQWNWNIRLRPKNYWSNEIKKSLPFPQYDCMRIHFPFAFHHFFVQFPWMNLLQTNAHHFSLFFAPCPLSIFYFFYYATRLTEKLTKGSILGLFGLKFKTFHRGQSSLYSIIKRMLIRLIIACLIDIKFLLARY